LVNDEALRVVGSMHWLDGVLVWQIRVKTFGFGHWPEPVMATSCALLKASSR
jgi:hypothetical protein